MESRRVLAIAASFLLLMVASRATAGTPGISVCASDQLAVGRAEASPPQQHQAAGLEIHNTGAPCRLALRISLTLRHLDGRSLEVAGGTSRLTLTSRRLTTGGRAFAVWAYTNYCSPDSPLAGPKVTETFRLADRVLRLSGGGAPCNRPGHPLDLRLLFACPSAFGPAVEAVTPRRLPLCPR